MARHVVVFPKRYIVLKSVGKHISQIIGISLAFCYLMLIPVRAQNPTMSSMPIVTIVVDGDRIVLSDGRKISLVGIDAPEKHPSEKLSMDALKLGKQETVIMRQGKLAADYLTNIAGGYSVLVQPIQGDILGGYIPSMVYVVDQVGQPLYSLNQKMLMDGYAVAAASINQYANETVAFDALVREAMKRGRGLWAEGGLLVPPRAVQSHDAAGAILEGSCSRNQACVWVSAGNPASRAGMWQSRPGRKCPCAVN